MYDEIDDEYDDGLCNGCDGCEDCWPECTNCGQPTPPEYIENLDDCYLGQCDWCTGTKG